MIGSAMYKWRSDLINIFFCAILPKLPINVSTQERHREAGERGWKINFKKIYWEGYLAKVLASFPDMVGGLCWGRIAATAFAN